MMRRYKVVAVPLTSNKPSRVLRWALAACVLLGWPVSSAMAQRFDQGLVIRIDVTRWVLSHGRVDSIRSVGIRTPENPRGQWVDGITPRALPPQPAGLGGILDVIAAQPDPERIDLDLNADGTAPRDPQAPSALVLAGANVPSGFTLVVAQLSRPGDASIMTHWKALVPRFGSGNYYATVNIPGRNPGTTAIVRGQELFTPKHFEEYTANSVIYEAPDIGNVIVDSTIEGGTSILRASGYMDLSLPARQTLSPSRRVGWADPLELELTELRQAPLDRDRDGVPDGTRIWVGTTLPNTFEPIGTRWLRVAAEANSGTRIFDIPAAAVFTVDLPLGPPRPFQQPDRTVKLSVVATSLGFGVPAGPTSPFLVQYTPAQIASGRQSVGLDTFHSRGITLGDTLVVQVKAKEEDKDKLVCPDLSGKWQMGGPYNVGQPTAISQQGNRLQFTNERGSRSSGSCRGDGMVTAFDWGNLTGRLSPGADRIDWRNGTWWIRRESAESCDIAGTWTNHTNVVTTWTFTRTADGFHAREGGGCNAKGTATLMGRTLKVVWRCDQGGFAGTYTWELNESCTEGKGRVAHEGEKLKGRSFSSTIKRGGETGSPPGPPGVGGQPRRRDPIEPAQEYVVWLHPSETTCCPADTKGEPNYAYHGTTADRVKAGAIVIGRFRNQEEMKSWTCNRQISPHYWAQTYARIGNYHVTRLPCAPTRR